MNPPELVIGKTIEEYKGIFFKEYCCSPIITFDGIEVYFRRKDFNHAFYESKDKVKDSAFSKERSERIYWIKAALQNPSAELYVGYDNKRKRYVRNRRVTIVYGNYVVIIELSKNKPNHAMFITAYWANSQPTKRRPKTTIDLIREGEIW